MSVSIEVAEKYRHYLMDFMQERNLTVNGWCKSAGVSEGTLRSFLKGRTLSLTMKNITKLANAVSVPVRLLIPDNIIKAEINERQYIDPILLAESIKIVDEIIQEKKLEIIPSKKAEIYACWYNLALQKGKTLNERKSHVANLIIKNQMKIKKSN